MTDLDLDRIRIVRANEARWEDLQTILTGTAGRCECERQRTSGSGSVITTGGRCPWRPDVICPRARCVAMKPSATDTVGGVASLDDEPMGWCAVDRRGVYGRLRGSPVPWVGRVEDKDDDSVWAIPCLVARKGYRGRGITDAPVAAAVDHARRRGAAAVEGCPMLTGGARIAWDEMSVGAIGPSASAGSREVSHPSTRRLVMRLEL